MNSTSPRRRFRLALVASVTVVASACASGGNTTIEPAAAPDDAATEPGQPDAEPAQPEAGPADGPASDQPELTAEQVAAVAIPFSKTRDPFEPVREVEAAAASTAGAEGAVVPAAPESGTQPVPAASPSTESTPQPTSEPTTSTCVTDLARCLESLWLLDAGDASQKLAVFQLGTTLLEVEVGARFADVFVLLALEGDCATIAHPEGTTERCVEEDGSLK